MGDLSLRNAFGSLENKSAAILTINYSLLEGCLVSFLT